MTKRRHDTVHLSLGDAGQPRSAIPRHATARLEQLILHIGLAPQADHFLPLSYWSLRDPDRYPTGMGEHIEQRRYDRSRTARKRPAKQTPELIGRRLLEIVVYDKCCRIGGTLTLDDLAETSEIGDWKMPDFKAACTYAVSPGLADRRGRYADAHHGGAGGG